MQTWYIIIHVVIVIPVHVYMSSSLYMYVFVSLQCPKSFRAQQMGLVGTQAQIAANMGVK